MTLKGDFFLSLILLSQVSLGVTISGRVYGWDDLEPVEGALIQVMQNSSLVSQVVTDEGGEYLINLGLGAYNLSTLYLENDTVRYFSSNALTLASGENTTFDIVLFPPTEEMIPEIELMDIPILSPDFDGNESIGQGGEAGPVSDPTLYVLLFFLSAAIASALLFLFRKRQALQTPEPAADKGSELPEELSDVVSIIKKEGGRMQQKQLQKSLGLSASKTSLLITDLESRGIVRRVKRGRGNVLILK